LDIPGGFGKVPVGANYIETKDTSECEKGSYQVRDQQGKLHNYKN
jgi:L-lysine 2,3-aminomutase